MKANRDLRFLDSSRRLPVILVLWAVCGLGVSGPEGGGGADTESGGFKAFEQALETADDAKANSIGDSIFGRLEQRFAGNTTFGSLRSKIKAAEFLGGRMTSELENATNNKMLSLSNRLFDEKESHSNKQQVLSVAPAKRFYEKTVRLFANPIRIDELDDNEKDFLTKYYDLKLRTLTGTIAKAGQALAIAEPSFKGTYDYVLVLPLLHVSSGQSINTDVLPQWMRRPEQLAVFSDSCLLNFGLPHHAMVLAEESALKQGKPFSKIGFYKRAAGRCGESAAHIAVDCLQKAIDCVPDNDPNITAPLELEIVQVWLDSENYALAAGRARKIFQMYPDHKDAGKAIWLHYYALSRTNDIEQILAHIDEALEDARSEAYRPELMYIKWWALRRRRHDIARIEALEYELLKQYRDNPIIAPVLLSFATDCLARQDYGCARAFLTELVERFPSTQAASQAEKMLDKLNTTKRIE